MNKIDLLIGFLIGILACLFGAFLFINLFTELDFSTGIQSLKENNKLAKLITLGAILDLIVFGILLKMNKELMARGVVMAVICIAILSIFA